MKRMRERYEDYKKALERLKEAMLEEPTEIIIDGTIQRYEFTFELAWKIMKDYLEYNGFIDGLSSPRNIIQLAFQNKIIKNGDIWIQMMLDRNLLSHLYDEEKSREIYNNIKNSYLAQFEQLKQFLEENIWGELCVL